MLAHYKGRQLKSWRQPFHDEHKPISVGELKGNSRGIQREFKGNSKGLQGQFNGNSVTGSIYIQWTMARKLVSTALMGGKDWEPISVRREQANDALWTWKQLKSWRQPLHHVMCEVIIAQTGNQHREIQREFNGNSVTGPKNNIYRDVSLLTT